MPCAKHTSSSAEMMNECLEVVRIQTPKLTEMAQLFPATVVQDPGDRGPVAYRAPKVESCHSAGHL